MIIYNEQIIKLEKSDEKGMLNAKTMDNYIEKALKATCKIYVSNGFGSGFFCLIQYLENDNTLLPVLITCYHVLEHDLDKDEIEIIINKNYKSISLKERKIWKSKELDFVCIEIKKEQDGIKDFYHYDKDIFIKNYLDKKVLTFGINKNDRELGFSNGNIKKDNNSFFEYTCNTTPGCSGGCIVKQSNNYVIGIHQGAIVQNNGKEMYLNQGIYIRDIIKRIKKDNSNYIENLEQILNLQNNGNELLKILDNDCFFFKINPENLKLDDTVQKLLFEVSRDKLYNDVRQQLNAIFHKVRNNINKKTPKQLREFKFKNYINEKLTEFNELFNNICEEDFHQLQNYLKTLIQVIKKQLTSFFEASIFRIIQDKFINTIIYPKNVQELLIEQNIPNLIEGKEYSLYFNLKEYKVLALDDNKVTLPGLTVQRTKIRDGEKDGAQKFHDKLLNIEKIDATFDPNSMEIKLRDDKIYYRKDSHIGCLRIDYKDPFIKFFKGEFNKINKPYYRNYYIDIYYDEIFINLPENFEFDILEGNNLRFNKISYHELVISAIYNQTLKVINIDESGNAVISKISIKPKNEAF